MKLRILLLAVIAIVMIVAACAPAPVVRDENLLKDDSLLTDDPCGAPCWQGIVVGETDWGDALTLIEDNSRFTNVETLQDDESDARAVTWQEGDGPTCCQMFSRNGEKVDTIFLLLAPDITVGEILDKYGDPEYVAGEEVTADQALLSLVFPENQLVIYAFVAGAEQGEVTETSEVVGAIYMTDTDMEDVLSNTNLYAWEGYQAYSDYIDGEFDHTAVPTGEGGDVDSESTAEAE